MTTAVPLCPCGCGQEASIAPRNNSSKGWVKGQPLRLKGHKKPLFEVSPMSFVKSGDWHECWPWTGAVADNGYGRVGIRNQEVHAHVAVYRLFKGELPEGKPLVRHSCDNKLCCNPAHFNAGTHDDNMRDKVERERQSRGESHGCAKLTEEDVRAIRAEYAAGGITQYQLAKKYGVTQTTIKNIVNRRTWKHV